MSGQRRIPGMPLRDCRLLTMLQDKARFGLISEGRQLASLQTILKGNGSGVVMVDVGGDTGGYVCGD